MPTRHANDEGAFNGAGGLRIVWRAWSPQERPAAQVVISHGAHEHGERYARLAARLTGAGFKAWAPDHRGHGHSDGPRGVIDRMDNAVDDLGHVVEMAHDEADGTPVFLVGHSLGGAVALLYALEAQEKLTGLVLSAPSAGDGERSIPPATRAALRLVSSVRPARPVHRLPADSISRDPAEVRAYRADPLIDQEPMRARTVDELVRAHARFRDEASTLRLPLLVLVGTGDVMTPPSGGRMIVDHASSADKELRLYDGFFHELINEPEPDRERVMDDIVDWLRARADPVPQA